MAKSPCENDTTAQCLKNQEKKNSGQKGWAENANNDLSEPLYIKCLNFMT